MPAQRAQRKRPGDFTGTNDEKLKVANAEELERAAEAMSMVNRVKAVQNSEVVDYTEDHLRSEAEKHPEQFLSPVPVKKQKYRIRVVADIDDMTFGHKWVEPADLSDPANPQPPSHGPLLHLSFKEGRQYDVDTPLYEHLLHLGYVWGEDCECSQCQQMYGVGV